MDICFYFGYRILLGKSLDYIFYYCLNSITFTKSTYESLGKNHFVCHK